MNDSLCTYLEHRLFRRQANLLYSHSALNQAPVGRFTRQNIRYALAPRDGSQYPSESILVALKSAATAKQLAFEISAVLKHRKCRFSLGFPQHVFG